MRRDPVLATLAGKLSARRKGCEPLAGKSTLNRLEHAPDTKDGSRYHKIAHDPAAFESLFIACFIEAHEQAPDEIILDLDATDDPLHGQQEGRFFHGYYGGYCYLPLYIFCGRHLLAAKLRRANTDASAGGIDELERIVTQIRRHWPEVRIVLRADSGFARDALMSWCEQTHIDFVFGLAKNDRLKAQIETEMSQAQAECTQTGKPARRFRDFTYRTLDSWSCARRVVGKAEQLPGKANPRFIVSSALAGTRTVRGAVLRPRRNGEPHQGVPATPVRRSHLNGDDAGQSAAAVVRLLRLRHARSAAPHRAGWHRTGRGHL